MCNSSQYNIFIAFIWLLLPLLPHLMIHYAYIHPSLCVISSLARVCWHSVRSPSISLSNSLSKSLSQTLSSHLSIRNIYMYVRRAISQREQLKAGTRKWAFNVFWRMGLINGSRKWEKVPCIVYDTNGNWIIDELWQYSKWQ